MNNLLEVADTERVEEGDHGAGDEREGAMHPGRAPAPEQGQGQGGADGELVGVVEDNVQVVVGNDHIRLVDSSWLGADHNSRIGSGKVEDRRLQADQAVVRGNGVREVEEAGRHGHTNNCHGGHTECGREVVV